MFKSTKVIELGSCAFRQPTATSHCRFLHGYRLTAKFWFEADSLDQNNWVVDFGGLKDLKKILQDQFDHTTCVSKEDPKLMLFKQMNDTGLCDLRIMDGVGIEKFAEWCWSAANKHVEKITEGRCRCIKAEVFEHENNSAIYEKQSKQFASDVDSTDADVQKPNNLQDNLGAVVNTNKNKITNQWVDKKSTNTWGL
jgi:6-pyruvoyltetrahydropterin/6-carboxytetrahydropterin synthase